MAKNNTASFDNKISRLAKQPLDNLTADTRTTLGKMAAITGKIFPLALALGIMLHAVTKKLADDGREGGLKQWLLDNELPLDPSQASRFKACGVACYGLSTAKRNKLPQSYEAVAYLVRAQIDGKRPYAGIGGAEKMLAEHGDDMAKVVNASTARAVANSWDTSNDAPAPTATAQATEKAIKALRNDSGNTALNTAACKATTAKAGSVQRANVGNAIRDLMSGYAFPLESLGRALEGMTNAKSGYGFPAAREAVADAMASMALAHKATLAVIDREMAAMDENRKKVTRKKAAKRNSKKKAANSRKSA